MKLDRTFSLIDTLIILFPDSSKRTHLQWIDYGRILVDGKVVKDKRTPVLAGQEVTLLPKDAPIFVEENKIVYQDRWLVVIDKASGILSVPLDQGGTENALHQLRQHFGSNSLFPVHRLDRDASGLLLFARCPLAETKLKELFERRSIKRNYFAVVEGRIAQPSGTWESNLLEEDNFDVVQVPQGRGKKAVTHYTTLHLSAEFSYLFLRLESGRKHQIRVHCQSAGHLIAGDKRYGALADPIKRLALHAFRLEFLHPFGGKKISLFSPLPPAFTKIVPPLVSSSLQKL